MSWFYIQFDPSWVRCTNCNCRAEFIRAYVKRKRKCPACKLDNRHQIKIPKRIKREQ